MSYVTSILKHVGESLASFDAEKTIENVKNTDPSNMMSIPIKQTLEFISSSSPTDTLNISKAALDIAYLICHTSDKFDSVLDDAIEKFKEYIPVSDVQLSQWTDNITITLSNEEIKDIISKILYSIKTTNFNFRVMYMFVLYVALKTNCYNDKAFEYIRSSVKRNPIGPVHRLLGAIPVARDIGGIGLATTVGVAEIAKNMRRNAIVDSVCPILSEEYHNNCILALGKNDEEKCINLINGEE